jgi:hypothetical protein
VVRLCRRIADRRPCRLIDVDGRPYLERYFLATLPGGGAIYLHRFLAPDPDRGLHDHPWPWALSLVLAGGYVEARGDPWGERRRRAVRPGRLNLIRGTTFHRIVALAAGEAWTLFAHGPRVKPWGFAVPCEPATAGELRVEGALARLAFDQPGQAPGWWRTAPVGREARRDRP